MESFYSWLTHCPSACKSSARESWPKARPHRWSVSHSCVGASYRSGQISPKSADLIGEISSSPCEKKCKSVTQLRQTRLVTAPTHVPSSFASLSRGCQRSALASPPPLLRHLHPPRWSPSPGSSSAAPYTCGQDSYETQCLVWDDGQRSNLLTEKHFLLSH